MLTFALLTFALLTFALLTFALLTLALLTLALLTFALLTFALLTFALLTFALLTFALALFFHLAAMLEDPLHGFAILSAVAGNGLSSLVTRSPVAALFSSLALLTPFASLAACAAALLRPRLGLRTALLAVLGALFRGRGLRL